MIKPNKRRKTKITKSPHIWTRFMSLVFWKCFLSLAVVSILIQRQQETSRRSQLMESYHSFYGPSKHQFIIKQLFSWFLLLVFLRNTFYFFLSCLVVFFFIHIFHVAHLCWSFQRCILLIGIKYRLWKMKSNLNTVHILETWQHILSIKKKK